MFHLLEQKFPTALAKIELLLAENEWRKDTWREQEMSGNWSHALNHFYDLLNNNPFQKLEGMEDHLVHLTCRLLMFLQLREEKR